MAQVNGNASVYFLDRQATGAQADHPAFIEADGKQRTITYRQLSERAAAVGDIYRRHGIRREDRVAMLVLDEIEFPIIFWGSVRVGVVPVAINTLLATDVYASILNDSRARVLFVSATLLPVVSPLLSNHPWLEKIFVIGGDATSHLDFGAELEQSTQIESVATSADETAFWLYSSGSTGQPKGVRHVHGSLQFTADTYGQSVLGITSADVVYSAAKFFFAYGLGNAMTFPMSVGATTVLLAGRPTPDAVIALLNKYTPSIFCGVPTLYAATIAYLESGAAQCEAKLRRCISAGEALPEDIGNQWQRITGCEILDGVGSTEMLHIFLSNAPGDVVYGTSGVAVPGYELRLVDEQGEEVGVGEVGELLVNGDSAASDYWNQREKSRNTFEGVWTRTGDKYERNERGRLIYCGRTDDMFKVSGIWVSPFEVEQALVSHSAVLEAAVVPARDADELEKPKAFVVLKNASTDTDTLADTLKEHVKERIGKWKYPRWVEVVDELPKTATGKIQRFKLRDDSSSA
jgi:4-hydroxybenzoate-CoA ligase